MKILIISNHSYMLYQFRKELIEELMKNHTVVLSMPFAGHEDDFQNMGIRCIDTKIDRRGVNPFTDLKLYFHYRSLLKKENPDAVVTYSIKPNIYAGIACSIEKIPYFINVQGLGTAFQKEPIASLVTFMYRLASKKANVVFFENEDNAAEFIKRKIIPEKQKAVLRGAGVNLSYYQQAMYPDEKNGIHFLYLGRIMKEKGIDEFFQAAKRLKKEYGNRVVFDCVGFFEDDYKTVIESLVQEGVIEFHGFQNDPRPFYAKSHCVVLPSYHEGMSNVLLEASATGRAVIASDIPGCRETVSDGHNGFLSLPSNADCLYDCMKKFLCMTEEERRQMGMNGRLKMEKEFDRSDVVRETINKIVGSPAVS